MIMTVISVPIFDEEEVVYDVVVQFQLRSNRRSRGKEGTEDLFASLRTFVDGAVGALCEEDGDAFAASSSFPASPRPRNTRQ